MATIKIEGVDKSVDGDYEFDFARRRTARELWHFKQIAKVGWDEIADTIREGSSPLVVSGIATLALVRAGKITKEQAVHFGDQLLDLGDDGDDGAVSLILTEIEQQPKEEEGRPPAEPLEPAAEPSGEPKERETTS